MMKLGILFSGGKDSTYATWLVHKEGYSISCLISVISENKESYMFHTPSVSCVREQANVMGVPIVAVKSKGEKEKELLDLERAIFMAVEKYKIEGVVTGAVGSVYQSVRIQKICDKLEIECFNPLWQKDQEELLLDLVKNKFGVIVVGVFAYPFDKSWLGRKIDRQFIREIKKLNEKYKINVAGEGGEVESFVLNCPLFKRKLKVEEFKDSGEGNSYRREISLK